MSTSNIKEEARRLLDNLPEDLTWDDLMHEIYVRQSIEAGLEESAQPHGTASATGAPNQGR